MNIKLGGMLQLISGRLIAAALFFLASVIYQCIYTISFEEMNNIGLVILKVFALLVNFRF